MEDLNELVPVRHRVTGARAMAVRRALAEPDTELEEIPAGEVAGKSRVGKDGQPERLTGEKLASALEERGLPDHGTAAAKRDRLVAHDAGIVYNPLNDLPLSTQEG